MAERPAVWGIDIGQAGLKAIKLRYQEGTDQVIAESFDYIAHPKILSQPDAIPDELINEALATFLSRNETEGDLIAVSVPGPAAMAKFIQLPPVDASKVKEIIRYEARQQIPFALEEVVWDYQPLGDASAEGGYLLDAEVGLFAIKREIVKHHLRPFDLKRQDVELVQISSLALYNFLAFDELGIRPGQPGTGSEDYYMILDVGADSTTILVTNGTKIWIRNAPIAGNHFTRALTKEMKLSFAKAEHLKCNATKSPDPKAVFQALRPVFADFVSEIQRSVGYFSSVNRDSKIAKVIGTGNGFKLAGLQKFLQQNLQYEVERLETFKGIAGDAVLNAPIFQENILAFAVPYGLAIQGLKLGKLKTSLLPPEITVGRKVKQKKPWALATAAGLLAGLTLSGMGYGNCHRRVYSESFDGAVKKADDLKNLVAEKDKGYKAEETAFKSLTKEINNLLDGRKDLSWLELMRTVNECLPRDVGDAQDQEDITKRNMVRVTSFTAQKYTDLKTEWFDPVFSTPEMRDLAQMTEYDQKNPPKGAGYVITLDATHFHKGADRSDQTFLYIRNVVLKGLQQWTYKPVGASEVDVRRMGISHVCAPNINWSDIQIPKRSKGPDGPRIQLPAEVLKKVESKTKTTEAAPEFSQDSGEDMGKKMADPANIMKMVFGDKGPVKGAGKKSSSGSTGSSTGNKDAAGEMETIEQTKFLIQFVWNYIPPEKRGDPPAALTGKDQKADTKKDAKPAEKK